MSENKQDTFKEKLYECDQHKKRLKIAQKNLMAMMPLTVERYNNLDDVLMSFIDQLIFRFAKLQDTMGDKLFPAFLGLTGEDIKKLTYIDRMNRLEELDIINRQYWMELRKNRNEIAHEYSFNTKDVVDSINIIYNITDDILSIYDKFNHHCHQTFNFLK